MLGRLKSVLVDQYTVPFVSAVLVAVEITYYTVPFVKAVLVAVRSLNNYTVSC